MAFAWNFFIYSLLGFFLELVYARATRCEKLDRKCLLLLPLCPVYGLGGALILALPPVILRNPLLLSLCAVPIATASEYAAALFYERAWKVRFWDYSGHPFQLHGRVCLKFSFFWSIISLFVVYVLHPYLVAPLIRGLPNALLLPLFLVFAADSLLTGELLRSTHSTAALIWYR